jgi:Phage head-tail joining protein.
MITDFFNSTATVKQLTTTKNPMGGLTKSYSTRISSMPCRLSTRNIREADEFGKITIREILRLYCSATSTNKAIEESDQIEISDRTFEVTGIHNPGELDRHLQIDLMEIK